MTLGELRRLIREAGLDADMRNMAGTFGGGISAAITDREAIMNPPPGLGSPSEEESIEDDGEPQRKNQPGARVHDRAGGASGTPDAHKVY